MDIRAFLRSQSGRSLTVVGRYTFGLLRISGRCPNASGLNRIDYHETNAKKPNENLSVPAFCICPGTACFPDHQIGGRPLPHGSH